MLSGDLSGHSSRNRDESPTTSSHGPRSIEKKRELLIMNAVDLRLIFGTGRTTLVFMQCQIYDALRDYEQISSESHNGQWRQRLKGPRVCVCL